MGCACRCCPFIPPIPSTSTCTTPPPPPPTTSGDTRHLCLSPSSLGLRKSEPESKSNRPHGRAFPPPLRSGNLGTFYSSMFLTSSPFSFSSDLLSQHLGSGHNNSNNNNNYGSGSGNGNGSGGGGCWNNPLDDGGYEGDNSKRLYLFLLSALGCFFWAMARARARARVVINSNKHAKDKGKSKGNGKDKGKDDEEDEAAVWVVKGGKWTRLVPDLSRNADDAFVVVSGACSGDADEEDDRLSSLTMRLSFFGRSLVIVIPRQCRNLFVSLMLPQGFPHSVTSDYLEYSLWRGVQGVASQISAVLATQSLLLAVGLGKGAIPAAAAVSWVLKDGIGYLSKIFLSKYGRHFDVNPKGWRLFADLLENAAFGLEISTPAFPHLFVFIGAAAGAGRSASALIQAATRSCFYAGFAAQRNFAEVIAKGEAQGMVSKSIGIMLGIPLAHCVGSSTPLALVSFGVITWVHMFCNLKSYQSIQLRTLNPFRASLVFSEYLLSGQVPSNIEVNDEEPLFPALPFLHLYPVCKVQPAVLSGEAKDAAAEIEHRLQLGSKLSDVVYKKEDVLALFYLYRNEDYILIEHKGKFCVILKETSSPQDMLKSLFHVNYLYWLEKQAGIKTRGTSNDCRPGGRLQTSLEYVQREFNHVRRDGESVGWITDGLIARPFLNRFRPGNASNAAPSA